MTTTELIAKLRRKADFFKRTLGEGHNETELLLRAAADALEETTREMHARELHHFETEQLLDDIGTLRWFGRSWGAPVNDPRAEIPTPEGAMCVRCGVPIQADHRGVSLPFFDGKDASRIQYHLGCWLEEVGVVS